MPVWQTFTTFTESVIYLDTKGVLLFGKTSRNPQLMCLLDVCTSVVGYKHKVPQFATRIFPNTLNKLHSVMAVCLKRCCKDDLNSLNCMIFLPYKIQDSREDLRFKMAALAGNCRCLAETCSCTLCSHFIYSISASSAR